MIALVKEGRPMPTLLSEWLRVAVEDVRRLPEECSTPELRFVPDMSTFVSTSRSGRVCCVCLAGAALIGTGTWQVPQPSEAAIPGWNDRVASAINALRAGAVREALEAFTNSVTMASELDLSPRLELAADRVEDEALAANLDGETPEELDAHELIRRLIDGPMSGARASDAAYLELADALAEMGL